MKAKAAVAWEPKKPLSIEMIDVEGPKNVIYQCENTLNEWCKTWR